MQSAEVWNVTMFYIDLPDNPYAFNRGCLRQTTLDFDENCRAWTTHNVRPVFSMNKLCADVSRILIISRQL